MNFNPAVRFDGVRQGMVVLNNFYDSDTTHYVVMRTRTNTGTLTATSTVGTLSGTNCDRMFSVS